MANDRIYLICSNCERMKTLAKYYPSLGHGIWSCKEVSDFIEEHMECSPYFGGRDLKGDSCFNLIAESHEDFNEKWEKHIKIKGEKK